MTEAQERIGSGFSRTFTPDPERARPTRALYRKYLELGRALEPLLREL